MKNRTPSIFEIEEFSFGRKFGLLGKLYFSELSSRLKYLGIEKNFSVLFLLDEMGEQCSQKFIADKLHIDKATMVGVIDDLGSRKFIKRTKNPSDRRVYWIQLTEKGKKHMPEIKAVVRGLNSSVLNGFSEQETKKFNKQLQMIYMNLNKISTPNTGIA